MMLKFKENYSQDLKSFLFQIFNANSIFVIKIFGDLGPGLSSSTIILWLAESCHALTGEVQ